MNYWSTAFAMGEGENQSKRGKGGISQYMQHKKVVLTITRDVPDLEAVDIPQPPPSQKRTATRP